MFFGEVFQEVKYWYRHMNIQTLKVVVFRQITQKKNLARSTPQKQLSSEL